MSNFDFDVIARSLPHLFLDGMRFTLTLTLLAGAGGLLLGTAVALLRLSGNRVLAAIAAGYVNLVRSLPLVLVIFWFYFLVPYIAQWITGSRRPVQVGAFSSALITFIVFEAAYFSEIVRAGIGAIPRGQFLAGQAIGLRPMQVTAYIILPQVAGVSVPRKLFLYLFVDGLFYHLQSVTAYYTMSLLSPVSQSVANTAKRALLIFLSIC